MKIKDWLRVKLQDFLDITSINQSLDGYAKLTNKKIEELYDHIDWMDNRIRELNDKVNKLHNTDEDKN